MMGKYNNNDDICFIENKVKAFEEELLMTADFWVVQKMKEFIAETDNLTANDIELALKEYTEMRKDINKKCLEEYLTKLKDECLEVGGKIFRIRSEG